MLSAISGTLRTEQENPKEKEEVFSHERQIRNEQDNLFSCAIQEST